MKLLINFFFQIFIEIICQGQTTDTLFYDNGKIFSVEIGYFEDSIYLKYILSPNGDTLFLKEKNYSGDLKDYKYRSFCKDLNSNIISIDDNGTCNTFDRKGDSIYIENSWESYFSMFSSIKNDFNLQAKQYLKLDSLFLLPFHSGEEFTEVQFKDYLIDQLGKLEFTDSIDFIPYINIASDMLYLPWNEQHRDKENTIPGETLKIYFDYFNHQIKDEKVMNLIYDYYKNQANINDGEWLYYSGLIRFLRQYIPKNELKAVYIRGMSSIVTVSSIQFKNYKHFETQYKNLLTIVDTLGNSFIMKKNQLIDEFLSELTSDELETINSVKGIYESVIQDYYSRFIEDDLNRTGGMDNYRLNYYELITKWQLKVPNYRLFRQNNRNKIPKNFDAVLRKFDQFLNEELYHEIVELEREMFGSLDGMNGYANTPYNHYFFENEVNRRKYRLFNWIINNSR